MILKTLVTWMCLTWIPTLAFAETNAVTLHLIPSPKGINWRKPQALAVSAIKNQIAHSPAGKRHGIGHVYVELECGNQHIMTGVTSQNDTEEREALFKQGYGLGILLKNYEGKMEAHEDVARDLVPMHRVGRSSFVRFLISDSACSRLLTYLDQYKANGYDQIYAGLNARPLYGESAGCSAFGTSFLELAGLQVPEFEQEWMTSRIIPRKFIGGPLTNRRVSIFKILLAFSAGWSVNPENNFPIHFWDPEKMDDWARTAYDDINAGSGREFPWPAASASIDQSPGVEFDATQVATPTGPIFKN